MTSKIKIFNGRKFANKILNNIKNSIKKEKLNPKLAIILIGNNEESKLYIKLKKEVAQKIGIRVLVYRFEKNTKENEIIERIKCLNKDKLVNGIIVQLPLPRTFNKDRIIESIDLKKDVDCFQKENVKLFKEGGTYFVPVTPVAILSALKTSQRNFEKKRVVALVRSEIFGETLKIAGNKKGVKINYFIVKKHLTQKVKSELKLADAIITICGKPCLINADLIKNGVVLIDAGISRLQNRKVVGDIDYKSVIGKASFLTPVPGGIGPLTIAVLLKNVYLSSRDTA
ncbi:MAG: bifunctional 5,10-methylenetetrahydrofolate dehydrogenase/5,10-methenyltetrahydrofolate cyclohydrolase [Patescibacteria group bacterium]|nr:bifunctional 5,10-methylenetetrahydrofolate dehydrogenase/5,10-methenyltetrahydrofolate cyclohydrolase [Patescibacteria group bacterium]